MAAQSAAIPIHSLRETGRIEFSSVRWVRALDKPNHTGHPAGMPPWVGVERTNREQISKLLPPECGTSEMGQQRMHRHHSRFWGSEFISARIMRFPYRKFARHFRGLAASREFT